MAGPLAALRVAALAAATGARRLAVARRGLAWGRPLLAKGPDVWAELPVGRLLFDDERPAPPERDPAPQPAEPRAATSRDVAAASVDSTADTTATGGTSARPLMAPPAPVAPPAAPEDEGTGNGSNNDDKDRSATSEGEPTATASWQGTEAHPALPVAERGRKYELLVVEALLGYGLHLAAVGRGGDQGIDFRGHWTLPDERQVRVVGQCKHYLRNRLAPAIVREFEGALGNVPPGALGILVTSNGYSEQAMRQFRQSQLPLMVCTLPTEFSNDGQDLASPGATFIELNPPAQALLPALTVGRKSARDRLSSPALLYGQGGAMAPLAAQPPDPPCPLPCSIGH